jgi:hypothetical protein
VWWRCFKNHKKDVCWMTNRLWTGPEYVNNLLNCGNLTRIHNILRMNLKTFYLLRDWLVSNTKRKSSRKVAVEEKLLIFITIASSIELSRVITRESGSLEAPTDRGYSLRIGTSNLRLKNWCWRHRLVLQNRPLMFRSIS